jgi:tryptophan halogenase
MKKFQFTIVGGGTAGWLTSLYIKKSYPWAEVTVISSSEIGILGAGEGTTPHFVSFLDELGIPTSEIIKKAKGTIKNGIRFTNWNGDNESYFHPFMDDKNLNNFSVSNFNRDGVTSINLLEIMNEKNLDDSCFSALSSYNNSVKFSINKNLDNKNDDPISHFNSLGTFGLHFDANLLAKFLKRTALYRGIRSVDAEVDEILTDEDGYITGIKTTDGKTFESNFVFDCSGFKRKIIGEFYKSEWQSYSDNLPMKRAISFTIENTSTDIPPYTDSIAMKNGWMWKIPVQGRFGCGYVFDSDFATDDEIKQELEEYFGYPIQIVNTFNFDAGRYKKTWIKNCIAIGLSAGFIEPLEATSIMTSILSLEEHVMNNLGAIAKNDFYVNRFNERVNKIHDDTKNFIYLHYLTKRNDSEFWKTFRDKNKEIDVIGKFLKECKYTIPDKRFIDSVSNIYSIHSWHSIGAGLGLFSESIASDMFHAIKADIRREQVEKTLYMFSKNLLLNLKTTINHSEFLDYLAS